MKKIILLILIVLPVFVNCKKDSPDNPPDYIDEEIGEGYFTVLPVGEEDFYLFVNLGHMNPPGHVFPSGHGGFYLTDYEHVCNIYSPGDLTVTRISRVEHLSGGEDDYTLQLSSPKGRLKIVFGHLSSISSNILDQAPSFDESECETYMAGGGHFRICSVFLEDMIEVSAGDIIGTGGGLPGQYGVDFGVFDKNRPVHFATDRFTDYDYMYAVSPLNYFTPKIVEILRPVCGDWVCGIQKIRTIEPIGSTVEFDSTGTLQGLWYKKDEPLNTEDFHIAFVYDNTDPYEPVISWGTSVPGNDPGVHTFTVENSGTVNRKFVDVTSDGNIYSYEIRNQCSTIYTENSILLVQLTAGDTLKLETLKPDDGPPWQFTGNAVYFTR